MFLTNRNVKEKRHYSNRLDTVIEVNMQHF